MATKLNREIASDEKMLFTKSHNPQVLWTPNVTGKWLVAWDQNSKDYISLS